MDMKSSIIYLMTLLMAVSGLSSCSEEDDSVEEFPEWQSYNESYWKSLYSTTEAKIKAGDTSWRIIPNYSYPSDAALSETDYIIVHVKEQGTGSGCPLYTDSVRVHYQGRLLPSASYSSGYLFDSSYTGELNTATAIPSKFVVSGVIDGWTTALQYMHIGDRWEVYIPYQLAYGVAGSDDIPGYSTLVFDVMLVAYWHPGAQVPAFNAKPHGGWIEE